jgi:hypothetical protein
MRPWLLMDVDGPLNPFAAPWFATLRPEDGYEFHLLTPKGGQTYPVALNPGHGRMLSTLAVAYDLAWATTWEDDANRLIAPILGLPTDLPVVPLPVPTRLPVDRCWKTEHVARWVGDRPFAWFDDEIDAGTRAFLRDHEDVGPHLALRVEPWVGLTDNDARRLAIFARDL